jgi:predicted glutamine amidotransferase
MRHITLKTQFRMLQSDKRQLCHIISSEPLTKDYNDWINVPDNHLISINPASNLMLKPIRL